MFLDADSDTTPTGTSYDIRHKHPHFAPINSGLTHLIRDGVSFVGLLGLVSALKPVPYNSLRCFDPLIPPASILEIQKFVARMEN
jgi:hypothetical protein